MVTAIQHATTASAVHGQTFNIAGGSTWRMTGTHLERLYDLLGYILRRLPTAPRRGGRDWYDTEASQPLLRYQETPYEICLAQIELDRCRLMGDIDELEKPLIKPIADATVSTFLDVGHRSVSIMGAGGKSTLMNRLAERLLGRTVVLTLPPITIRPEARWSESC